MRSIHPSIRDIGLCRNGTSCATKRSPSGSIQSPNTGKKLKKPPTINKMASGMRANREEGLRSQATARAGFGGSFPSNQAKCRSNSFLSCPVTALSSFALMCSLGAPLQGVSLSRAGGLESRRRVAVDENSSCWPRKKTSVNNCRRAGGLQESVVPQWPTNCCIAAERRDGPDADIAGASTGPP